MSLRPLSPALAAKAQKELFEEPARVGQDIAHLKDWLSKQPHIRARTDDQWLLTFLRGCKFSLERTKEKLDLFYSMRGLAPELYCVRHTHPKFNEILDLGVNVVLPKTASPTSPVVMIVRPGRADPNKYHITEVISASNIIQKIMLMENDQLTICGAETILDLEGVSMGHLTQMTPTLMKKMVVLGQDAAPIRMKGAHYLNTPSSFQTLFNIMKPLLNKKNQERLHVHNKDYEGLYKYVPKEILPEEYNGGGGSIKEITDYWKKKIEEYSTWLEEDYSFGTDESKRPGRPKSADEMFGAEGSFRSLQVD